ncbi:C40 family peptidase [Cohnella lupini]|uniref:Cell wall-associated NlpC family hydrolase n=1 Tax=Cohnella lupini TaxID=1294267 RepID=A0A3D9HYZ3_9BACL|nr:C40 family peptidase [Cohnella lupini]RED54748.1 cell wall-associated NlpC family hydrolase [Cohnella lupini]
MTNKSHFKKIIIGAACFMMMATGIGMVAGQQSAFAATTSPASVQENVATASSAPEIDNVATVSSASAQKKASIIAVAKSLKGKVTYKFGVNNPAKLWFDCSSFTKYVFAKQGISLKWGTAAQSKQGTYVAKKNLQPGDLIFLSVSTPGKINHVGIYIGGGQFIHNTIGTSFNGLLISKVSDYSSRYITARRVG